MLDFINSLFSFLCILFLGFCLGLGAIVFIIERDGYLQADNFKCELTTSIDSEILEK